MQPNNQRYAYTIHVNFFPHFSDPYDPDVVKRLQQQRQTRSKGELSSGGSDETNNIKGTHCIKLSVFIKD
jgi:hypothetical protein